MDDRPVTRYAKAPDGVSIAYWVSGEGPLDIVRVAGFPSPLDLMWEESSFVHFAKRLGRFSRTVWCEHRGTGASGGDCLDGLTEPIANDDLTAVLDAVGCDRVVLVGVANGGAVAVQYAAAHPERVAALVLINSYAHYVREDDYPWGLPRSALDRFAAPIGDMLQSGAALEVLAPSKAGDERFRSWYARVQRLGLPPERISEAFLGAFRRDVRSLLPTLAVPTIVLHREGNRFIRVGAGRYLAEHIPCAKYVELPGDDHAFYVGDSDGLLDEVEEFLTGSHHGAEGDVTTATILFTDIVASTEQSARLGHRKWTTMTDAHDAMVRAALQRHRGREIKTIGDAFLATFDATTRAVRAAVEIVDGARKMGLEVRAGVHIGEVELRSDDVVGLPVTIAKRICDLAGSGEVFVSETVKGQLVGSGIAASERGTHILKGVPDEWRLFTVER